MNKYESPEWKDYDQSQKVEAMHRTMSELIGKFADNFAMAERDMHIMAEKIEKLELHLDKKRHSGIKWEGRPPITDEHLMGDLKLGELPE